MLTDEEKKEKYYKTFKRLVGVELARTYSMHGYQDLAPGVAETITELAVLLNKNLAGIDAPLTLEHANGRQRNRHKRSV